MPVIPFDPTMSVSAKERPHIDARSLHMIKVGLDHLIKLHAREQDPLGKHCLEGMVELLTVVVERHNPPLDAV
ncbi:hypothetical protein KC131_03525 [Pseudomonas sp. JQ170]|uniref:hypothetical protein n=1 Tax=unclassified Pseudomonas TaxID=196821 RepID=UPI00264FC9B2|nr:MULTISPECIES: hypothetical protein [unclassified Pseudomonas]MDN7139704.1 hypothetical protein [Pseudomonas sp. JQ170]WRO76988.1 hypothetical protein U9R80_04720 [Pseudomonas sp. 170C]